MHSCTWREKGQKIIHQLCLTLGSGANLGEGQGFFGLICISGIFQMNLAS